MLKTSKLNLHMDESLGYLTAVVSLTSLWGAIVLVSTSLNQANVNSIPL